MTLDEADAIIAELNICFPSRQLLVEEVKRWENNLLEFHFEDGKKAVKRIEDKSRFWPSWAEFREAILPFHKDRVWIANDKKERELRELEKPMTSEEKEKISALIKQVRQGLFKEV